MATVWPLFMGDLGATAADIGLVIGAGTACAVVLLLPLAHLADRIGRKPVLIALNASALLAALVFLSLGDWRPGFIGSALFWTSAAGSPLVLAHVVGAEPRLRLGRALGTVLGAFSIGMIIAAPLAGRLAQAASPRAAIGLAAAFFVLTIIVTLFISRGARGPAPTTPATRLPRAFWVLLFVIPVAAFVTELPAPLLPLYLGGALKLSLDDVGLIVGLSSFGNALFAVAAGRLNDLRGPTITLVSVAAVFVVGATLLLGVGRSEIGLGVAAVLLGAAYGANPVLAAALERVLPADRIATGYAAFQLAFMVGLGAAAAAAGQLYEREARLPFIVAAALALPLAMVVAGVVHRMSADRFVRRAGAS